jgi:hypothetical protein
MDQYYSLDEALYLSNKQKISTRISIEYGLRYSFFQNIGKDTVYSYNGTPDRTTVSDTTFFDQFQSIKSYSGLEPRISGRVIISSE